MNRTKNYLKIFSQNRVFFSKLFIFKFRKLVNSNKDLVLSKKLRRKQEPNHEDAQKWVSCLGIIFKQDGTQTTPSLCLLRKKKKERHASNVERAWTHVTNKFGNMSKGVQQINMSKRVQHKELQQIKRPTNFVNKVQHISMEKRQFN